MKQRITEDYIPFSWTLLFIALLHFSVYSFGVCEAPAKDFFIRESNSLKGGAPRGLGVTITVPEEAFIYRQLDRESVRLIQERDHLILGRVPKQTEHQSLVLALSRLQKALLFPSTGSYSSDDAAATARSL